MPLYEYRCHKCGNLFEAMQKFSDEPLKTHADCGGEVERLISAPALQFKGSGWYITDYAKSGGGSGKNGGSESKSDTKSETKSETKSSDSSTKPATSSGTSSDSSSKGS